MTNRQSWNYIFSLFFLHNLYGRGAIKLTKKKVCVYDQGNWVGVIEAVLKWNETFICGFYYFVVSLSRSSKVFHHITAVAWFCHIVSVKYSSQQVTKPTTAGWRSFLSLSSMDKVPFDMLELKILLLFSVVAAAAGRFESYSTLVVRAVDTLILYSFTVCRLSSKIEIYVHTSLTLSIFALSVCLFFFAAAAARCLMSGGHNHRKRVELSSSLFKLL